MVEIPCRGSSGRRCPLRRPAWVDVCTCQVRTQPSGASIGKAPIEPRELLSGSLPTRIGRTRARAGSDQGFPGRSVPRRQEQRLGKGEHVARRDEKGGITDHLGDRPRRCCHHRHAERHRLQWWEAEALVERGVGEQARARR